MTTAADRLQLLAGTTGTAAALLLLIGSGATTGAALVDYSQLASATAAEHLLVDHASDGPLRGGLVRPRRPHARENDEALLLILGAL